MDDPSAAPYAGLTPDCVLDALDAVGLFCDGRLLALNSYENRVYQAWLDERAKPSADTASSVVVKFYRPSRWSDEEIGEEHAVVSELAAREIPVVAPIARGGATLHRFADFRYAV